MNDHSDVKDNSLREKLIGIGEHSFHKTYYPQLLEQMQYLQEKSVSLLNMLEDLEEAKNELEESEARFRAILENSQVALYKRNYITNNYEYFSPVIEKITGYTSEEIKSHSVEKINELIDHNDLNKIQSSLASIINKGGGKVEVEYKIKHKSGHIRWVSDIGEIYLDSNGKPLYCIGSVQDITERKKSEIKILENEQLFRALVENSPDFIGRYDLEFRRIYVNPALQKLIGGPSGNVIGHSPNEGTPIFAPKVYIDHLRKAIETSTECSAEIPFRNQKGEMRWGHERFVPEISSNGKVISVLAIGRDVNEIKEKEQSFRMLANNFPDFVFRFNKNIQYTYVNPTVEKALDLPSESFIGKSLLELPPFKKSEQNDLLVTLIQHSLNEGINNDSEIHGDTQMGERIFELRIIPEKDAAGKFVSVLTIARDITERKQMEETVAAREREFRSLAENSPDNIIRYDLNCRAIYCNKKIFTTDPEFILGKTPTELGAGGAENDAKYEEHVMWVLENGRSSELELDLQLPNGEFTNHLIRFVPERNIDNKITGVLAIGQDITERRRSEEEIRKLNTELEQRVFERTAQLETANKELEAFAYSVSHDLRAPLRHIDGFLKLLQEKIQSKLDEQSIHYMITIANSAKKMGTLIDDLLSFSRMGRSVMSRTNVNLNVLIQEVIKDLQSEIQGRNINWKISEFPIVVGDKALLQVVLVNLISNAIKFTGTREKSEIEIGSLRGEEKEIVVFVRDNGVGFDMNYASKLFGVFQRLHRTDEFEGTGIGLANVHRIINKHGGRTWAIGEVNNGATFYFSLPKINIEDDHGNF